MTLVNICVQIMLLIIMACPDSFSAFARALLSLPSLTSHHNSEVIVQLNCARPMASPVQS